MAEKTVLSEKIQETSNKLERASKLTTGLADEQVGESKQKNGEVSKKINRILGTLASFYAAIRREISKYRGKYFLICGLHCLLRCIY
jgi:hypothetical protein